MASKEETKAKARRGVQGILDRYHKLAQQEGKVNGLPELADYDCMSRVEVVDADVNWVVFKFKITQQYANENRVLHGGAYGVLFDMFTMMALGTIARPGYWEFMGGVTRNLSIIYLRAVPVGTTVYFRSQVVQHGKRIALIRGQMTNEDGSHVYALADHHKVNAPMLPEHKKARVAWDDEMDADAKTAKTSKL